MALITLPNIARSSFNFKRVTPYQENINEYTGRRQVVTSDRGWWECRYTLPDTVGQSDFYAWEAFIALAQNPDNSFRVRAEEVQQNGYSLGTAPGSLAVAGASQTGRSLTVDGAPTTGTVSNPVIPAGCKITVEDVMYTLTSGLNKTAASQVITIEPPLRSSPADNASIEWLEPYCLMYLAEVPDHPLSLGNVSSLSFLFREVVS